MTTIYDFFSPHDADTYRCFKAQGASGIGRYLVLYPQTDPRACTPAERDAAFAAGLALLFFFEMSPTTPGYFTAANGARDARAAIAHLDLLGAPRGVTVYFTVDAPASVIPPQVLDPYFNAIEASLRDEAGGSTDPNTWRLWPGIYGYEAHIEYARANYPIVGRTR